MPVFGGHLHFFWEILVRNFLMMICFCATLCLAVDSPAWAGGGGSDGPTGKSAERARFVLDNNLDDAVSFWIRVEGTELPATVALLDRELIDLTPNRQNRRTGRLLSGTYVITAFFTSDVQDFINADLDQDLFDDGAVDEVTVELDGEDIDVMFGEDANGDLVITTDP